MTIGPSDPGAGRASGDESVTALVVVRPARRASNEATSQAMSEAPSRANLDLFRPDENDVAIVASSFRALGFEVGPLLGNSMAITATASKVERIFGTAGDPSEELDGSEDRTLPVEALDAELAACIEHIVFEPPAELHEERTEQEGFDL